MGIIDDAEFLSACDSTIKDPDSGHYPLCREDCIRLLEIAKSAEEMREALERLTKAAAVVLLQDIQDNYSDAAFGELNMAAYNARRALDTGPPKELLGKLNEALAKHRGQS